MGMSEALCAVSAGGIAGKTSAELGCFGERVADPFVMVNPQMTVQVLRSSEVEITNAAVL